MECWWSSGYLDVEAGPSTGLPLGMTDQLASRCPQGLIKSRSHMSNWILLLLCRWGSEAE